MTLSTHQHPNQVWHISVTGRIDHAQATALEQALTNAIDHTETPKLMIDLSEATYINSGGLRLLVSAWRVGRQKGGNIILFGLNEKIQEVFSLVGFDKVFQIVANKAEALAFWEQVDE